MEYYISSRIGRTLIISFRKGDYLREALAELALQEGIENAVITSGIATFDEAKIQMTTTSGYPIGYHVEELNQPLELASLSGTIINSEPHIHGVISNPETTWSGHLLDGCRILYLGEVVVQELLGCSLKRYPDENGVYLISEKIKAQD